MAAPTYTPQLAMILQGTTAQTWAGPAMSAGSTSVGNLDNSQAPGQSDPMDVPGRPGFMQAGEPGGNPSLVLIPNTDGNGASGATVQTVGSPAGTAGGGGQYPAASGAGVTAVANPMLAPGWTVQSGTGDDYEQMLITTASAINETHAQAFSVTLAASGGDGTYTWSQESGILPTGVTFTGGASGVLAGTTSTSAGSATFEVKVVDSHGNTAQKIFTLTLS